jgi:hypothetical protein
MEIFSSEYLRKGHQGTCWNRTWGVCWDTCIDFGFLLWVINIFDLFVIKPTKSRVIIATLISVCLCNLLIHILVFPGPNQMGLQTLLIKVVCDDFAKKKKWCVMTPHNANDLIKKPSLLVFSMPLYINYHMQFVEKPSMVPFCQDSWVKFLLKFVYSTVRW